MYKRLFLVLSIFFCFYAESYAQSKTADSINSLVLVDEIPDISIEQGGYFAVDVTSYFVDSTSKIEFFALMPGGRSLPQWIHFDNGVISGSFGQPVAVPVQIKAVSSGGELSAYFNVFVRAKINPMLRQLGTVQLASFFDKGAAEISAYDPYLKRLFVTNAETNSIEIVSIRNPSVPFVVSTIDISSLGGNVNSVAYKNGMLAAAIEDTIKQNPGKIAVFNSFGALLWYVQVGALPDMVTFNQNGTKILSANEGEPSSDYEVDPEGSVSVIDVFTRQVSTASFWSYNNKRDELIAAGVRIFGPNATVAQDMEPEYITVEGNYAYVTCQENNAIAVVNIAAAQVVDIYGLGYKDHSLDGNGFDASNKAGYIDIRPWPVLGVYQPDAIASVVIDGQTYLVTANEGDARDYDGYSEEIEFGDISLDSALFPNRDELADKVNLGKLKLTSAMADTTDGGEYKKVYSFGARSFSIWNAHTGQLVYDSGDNIEQITASLMQNHFNCADDDVHAKDRSDNKGPEPEALTVGEINGRIYAFVGLERQGGIMVYDITDPFFPQFRDYVNNRNFDFDPEDEFKIHGDNAPEGLLFISAEHSPINEPMIVVSNEVSGTVTLYAVTEPWLPMQIQRFTLVNAFTGNDILTIDDGDVIDYAEIGTYFTNIRVNVDNAPSKVKMQLRGRVYASRIDKATPFTLFFERKGFHLGRHLPAGEYVLSAVLSEGRKFDNTTKKVVCFSVVDSQKRLKSDSQYQYLDQNQEFVPNGDATIGLYPMPFESDLFVDVQGAKNEVITIIVSNTLGQKIVVFEKEMEADAGAIVLHIPNIPSGIYVISIPQFQFSSTVIKK